MTTILSIDTRPDLGKDLHDSTLDKFRKFRSLPKYKRDKRKIK